MGRAPCCEKMGLKKGPWTAEEDRILIDFINQNGHDNWRALPKRAGLLRCGKSCRLRWMNYLRPDIKRGNFSPEEEEAIINLHQELGNRWSVIAARLPGRTDNEIKNVWHTNLKKRLSSRSRAQPEAPIYATESSREDTTSEPNSPQLSTSETSSLTNTASAGGGLESPENLLEMDESFWSEVLTGEDCGATSVFSAGNSDDLFPFSDMFGSDLNVNGSTDFWCNLFNRPEDLVKVPEF